MHDVEQDGHLKHDRCTDDVRVPWEHVGVGLIAHRLGWPIIDDLAP